MDDINRTPAFVEVQSLCRTFDLSKPLLNRLLEREPRKIVRAVQDVSFRINKGETFALVGESGCGKSTVAKMMAGLLSPERGSVVVDEVNVSSGWRSQRVRQVRRRLQMIFQDPYASLNPRWCVDWIISEPIRAFGLLKSEKDIADRVAELLTLVKLSPEDGVKYPHEFSGGQRQRIAIARALSSNPDFIICDEPTSALDVSVQAQILNLMKDLQDEFGLTYLFISHDLAVVRYMAKRIGVMYLGRIVEEAPTDALFKAARHPYTQMLLAAVPDISMSGKTRERVQGEVPNPIDPPAGCAFHPRCPFAFQRCKTELPLAIESGADHYAACHGVDEDRISVFNAMVEAAE